MFCLSAKRLICCLLLFWPLASPAQDGLDLRVLIDVSGSMRENDPQNLRGSALRLLAGLLQADTRAGVWTFDEHATALVPLGMADQKWKAQARGQSLRIGFQGRFTDIEQALQAAIEDWVAPANGQRRAIILLTDGKVDLPSDQARNSASYERIRQQILPRLKQFGAVVHTLGLSAASDDQLLQVLSEKSGGWFEKVANADELQKAFLHMFSQLDQVDEAPLEANSFLIDAQVREAILVIFRGFESETVSIADPHGEVFTLLQRPPDTSWYRDSDYEMVTLKQPAAGLWRIMGQVDAGNRVLLVTDLGLEITGFDSYMLKGARVPLGVHLTEQGRLLDEPSLLKRVRVRGYLSDPSGRQADVLLQTVSAPPDGGGINLSVDTNELPLGDGELVIEAVGETFRRQRRLRYSVAEPVSFTLEEDTASGRILLRVQPDYHLIDRADLQLSVGLKAADGESYALDLSVDDEGLSSRGWIDNSSFTGVRQLFARISGRTLSGLPFDREVGLREIQGRMKSYESEIMPVDPSSTQAPAVAVVQSEWEQALTTFAMINLLLLLVGVLLILWWRRWAGHEIRLTDVADKA